MDIKSRVMDYIEQNKKSEREKIQYENYVKLITEDLKIDLEEVTVDEETAIKQKGVFHQYQSSKVNKLFEIIKIAYFVKHNTELPKEPSIIWKTGPNSYILSDCVVEIVLKYSDKTILPSLDGFSNNHELKDPRLQELVELVLNRMQLPVSKKGALHSQLSIIGCAFNKAMGYNKQSYDKYRNYINQKLATTEEFVLIEDDEETLSEVELNEIETEYKEGAVTNVVLKRRKRNRKARLKVLERDQYTCTCCGLTPIAQFKHTLHVHHVSQMHSALQERNINFNQLITLCPTCHGYIHSRKEHLSVNEVKKVLGLF